MTDILAAMQDFMRTFKPQPARELRCGIAVWDVLRDLKPTDTGPATLGAALLGLPLDGIPVRIHPSLKAGQWELREDGVTVRSGDIAPEPGALYLPGGGFFAISLNKEFEG